MRLLDEHSVMFDNDPNASEKLKASARSTRCVMESDQPVVAQTNSGILCYLKAGPSNRPHQDRFRPIRSRLTWAAGERMEFEAARGAIERAASVDELSAVLFDLRNESGLAHLVYHAAFVPASDKANPLLLLTYDDAWVKRYVERDYFRIDPVVLAGRKSFLPIDWLTVEHSSKEARHFFAEAESYGVGRHGFTLPIRGPAGERALFTITTNATDEHWHRWRFSHLRDFHLLAHYFHDRAMRLANLRYDRVMRPLSPREKQCLESLMQGQAPGQVADALGLSVSAVHAYLRTARQKLECGTLEQAIAKAIRLDIVQ
jgi:DNA-binding CsgD family transcriptional regulator